MKTGWLREARCNQLGIKASNGSVVAMVKGGGGGGGRGVAKEGAVPTEAD